MLTARMILGVFACAILMQLTGAWADARTPTPTSATATPPEPGKFVVIPWVNAQDQAREVIAKIGERVCATGVPLVPPASPPGSGDSRVTFSLSVPSENVLPGCGREGAVVTFFVDGRQAPQTAVWRSGGIAQIIDAIIGPPFAYFSVGSNVEVQRVVRAGGRLVPYIDNKPCGYGAIVYSNEQEPGCGVEGSQITFKLLDAQGNAIAVARETGLWHAWDGLSDPQQLNLTFGPATVITMPGTGSGGGPRGHATTFATLAVALSGIALVGVATAAALRKKTTTR